MARKQPSRNNRHQTKGLYTTNPTQSKGCVQLQRASKLARGLRPIGHAKKLIFRLNAAHKSDMTRTKKEEADLKKPSPSSPPLPLPFPPTQRVEQFVAKLVTTNPPTCKLEGAANILKKSAVKEHVKCKNYTDAEKLEIAHIQMESLQNQIFLSDANVRHIITIM
ncbi:5677_t:CDS:2 [Rhizophagus irregularis]|nr:5677_t:CDS:2 [Rhizophagus irregularis]